MLFSNTDSINFDCKGFTTKQFSGFVFGVLSVGFCRCLFIYFCLFVCSYDPHSKRSNMF